MDDKELRALPFWVRSVTGFTTANVDNDPGRDSLFRRARSSAMRSCGPLISATVALVVYEMAARMGAVTGRRFPKPHSLGKIRAQANVPHDAGPPLAADLGKHRRRILPAFALRTYGIFGLSKYVVVPLGALPRCGSSSCTARPRCRRSVSC